MALVSTAALAASTAGPAVAVSPAPTPPATAAQLQAQADRDAALLFGTEKTRAAADAEASAALEAFQQATRTAEQADIRARRQARAQVAAERATVRARVALSRYLGAMYRNGVGTTRLSALTSLVDSPNPQRLFGGLGLAQRVGEGQDDAVAGLARAEAAQQAAAVASRQFATAARSARAAAATARRSADTAVAAAAARVAQARAALDSTRQAVALASAREARLAAAEVLARQRAGIPAAAIDGAYALRAVAGCTGGPTAGYPNGQLPTASLCALWGTSGQALRADAAAAFDAMSRAYAEVFSAPICVTDSYRDYPSQVAVAAVKPDLAAVPGTSNHGWGVAVDLCDGVQNFASLQHAWLQANSLAYGWFHPAWAQQGGSKPEAWHWEFAG